MEFKETLTLHQKYALEIIERGTRQHSISPLANALLYEIKNNSGRAYDTLLYKNLNIRLEDFQKAVEELEENYGFKFKQGPQIENGFPATLELSIEDTLKKLQKEDKSISKFIKEQVEPDNANSYIGFVDCVILYGYIKKKFKK